MTHRTAAIYSVAPLIGVASYVAPLLASDVVTGNESWLELYAISVEKASGPTFFLLFVAGLLAGGADAAVRALRFGVLTIALLPVAAVIQMAGDPTSHNLWPIEFVIYLVVSLVPACGVLLGRHIGPILFWPSDGKD
ncbi:MAG TPA: hypothetical protein VKC17_10325 [Sphingomicrobium sp.]|jgi:hypothetical protein|nr:hypothetical protein [Sphingomicrobium sp.]